jgi:hypothetical protein
MSSELGILVGGARAGQLVQGKLAGIRLVYDTKPYEAYELTDETQNTPYGRARILRGRSLQMRDGRLLLGE